MDTYIQMLYVSENIRKFEINLYKFEINIYKNLKLIYIYIYVKLIHIKI